MHKNHFVVPVCHTVYDRQLRFLRHMLQGTYSPHARTYALY